MDDYGDIEERLAALESESTPIETSYSIGHEESVLPEGTPVTSKTDLVDEKSKLESEEVNQPTPASNETSDLLKDLEKDETTKPTDSPKRVKLIRPEFDKAKLAEKIREIEEREKLKKLKEQELAKAKEITTVDDAPSKPDVTSQPVSAPKIEDNSGECEVTEDPSVGNIGSESSQKDVAAKTDVEISKDVPKILQQLNIYGKEEEISDTESEMLKTDECQVTESIKKAGNSLVSEKIDGAEKSTEKSDSNKEICSKDGQKKEEGTAPPPNVPKVQVPENIDQECLKIEDSTSSTAVLGSANEEPRTIDKEEHNSCKEENIKGECQKGKETKLISHIEKKGTGETVSVEPEISTERLTEVKSSNLQKCDEKLKNVEVKQLKETQLAGKIVSNELKMKEIEKEIPIVEKNQDIDRIGDQNLTDVSVLDSEELKKDSEEKQSAEKTVESAVKDSSKRLENVVSEDSTSKVILKIDSESAIVNKSDKETKEPKVSEEKVENVSLERADDISKFGDKNTGNEKNSIKKVEEKSEDVKKTETSMYLEREGKSDSANKVESGNSFTVIQEQDSLETKSKEALFSQNKDDEELVDKLKTVTEDKDNAPDLTSQEHIHPKHDNSKVFKAGGNSEKNVCVEQKQEFVTKIEPVKRFSTDDVKKMAETVLDQNSAEQFKLIEKKMDDELSATVELVKKLETKKPSAEVQQKPVETIVKDGSKTGEKSETIRMENDKSADLTTKGNDLSSSVRSKDSVPYVESKNSDDVSKTIVIDDKSSKAIRGNSEESVSEKLDASGRNKDISGIEEQKSIENIEKKELEKEIKASLLETKLVTAVEPITLKSASDDTTISHEKQKSLERTLGKHEKEKSEVIEQPDSCERVESKDSSSSSKRKSENEIAMESAKKKCIPGSTDSEKHHTASTTLEKGVDFEKSLDSEKQDSLKSFAKLDDGKGKDVERGIAAEKKVSSSDENIISDSVDKPLITPKEESKAPDSEKSAPSKETPQLDSILDSLISPEPEPADIIEEDLVISDVPSTALVESKIPESPRRVKLVRPVKPVTKTLTKPATSQVASTPTPQTKPKESKVSSETKPVETAMEKSQHVQEKDTVKEITSQDELRSQSTIHSDGKCVSSGSSQQEKESIPKEEPIPVSKTDQIGRTRTVEANQLALEKESTPIPPVDDELISEKPSPVVVGKSYDIKPPQIVEDFSQVKTSQVDQLPQSIEKLKPVETTQPKEKVIISGEPSVKSIGYHEQTPVRSVGKEPEPCVESSSQSLPSPSSDESSELKDVQSTKDVVPKKESQPPVKCDAQTIQKSALSSEKDDQESKLLVKCDAQTTQKSTPSSEKEDKESKLPVKCDVQTIQNSAPSSEKDQESKLLVKFDAQTTQKLAPSSEKDQESKLLVEFDAQSVKKSAPSSEKEDQESKLLVKCDTQSIKKSAPSSEKEDQESKLLVKCDTQTIQKSVPSSGKDQPVESSVRKADLLPEATQKLTESGESLKVTAVAKDSSENLLKTQLELPKSSETNLPGKIGPSQLPAAPRESETAKLRRIIRKPRLDRSNLNKQIDLMPSSSSLITSSPAASSEASLTSQSKVDEKKQNISFGVKRQASDNKVYEVKKAAMQENVFLDMTVDDEDNDGIHEFQSEKVIQKSEVETPESKQLGFKLKIAKSSTTIIPKDDRTVSQSVAVAPILAEKLMSQKSSERTIGSITISHLGSSREKHQADIKKVEEMLKDTDVTITPLVDKDPMQKLNKITLKIGKDGNPPEIKQTGEKWPNLDADIVPMKRKPNDQVDRSVDDGSRSSAKKVKEESAVLTTSSGVEIDLRRPKPKLLTSMISEPPLSSSQDTRLLNVATSVTPQQGKLYLGTPESAQGMFAGNQGTPGSEVVKKKRGRPRKIPLPEAGQPQNQQLQMQQHHPVIQHQQLLTHPGAVAPGDGSEDYTPGAFPQVPLFDMAESLFDQSHLFPNQVTPTRGRPQRSCRGRIKLPSVRSRKPRGSTLAVRAGTGRGRGRGYKRQFTENENIITLENVKEEMRRQSLDQQPQQFIGSNEPMEMAALPPAEPAGAIAGPAEAPQPPTAVIKPPAERKPRKRKNEEEERERIEKIKQRREEKKMKTLEKKRKIAEAKAKEKAAVMAAALAEEETRMSAPERKDEDKKKDIKIEEKKEEGENTISLVEAPSQEDSVLLEPEKVPNETIELKEPVQFAKELIEAKESTLSFQEPNAVIDLVASGDGVVKLEPSSFQDIKKESSATHTDSVDTSFVTPKKEKRVYRCLICKEESPLKKLTSPLDHRSWRVLYQAAIVRGNDEIINLTKDLSDEIPTGILYHRNCRSEFTHKKTLAKLTDCPIPEDQPVVVKIAGVENINPNTPKEVVMEPNTITEYQWPLQGGELYMIQEQVSDFIEITSFKRKYPDIFRRTVESEEKAYLRDNGLVSEAHCDLGLTAVRSCDVLDLMFADFQDKYEEFRKQIRDKQARELSSKHKAAFTSLLLDKRKFDYRVTDVKQDAMQAVASWNSRLNKARTEQRRCMLDLQSMIVHYPKTVGIKRSIVPNPPSKVGHYPVALVPGQFCDNYKKYNPAELKYFPLNTVIYGPMKPNERHGGGSDGSQTDSEDSSSSDDSSDTSSDSSDESDASGDESNEKDAKERRPVETHCKICGGDKTRNKQDNPEVLINCAQCTKSSQLFQLNRLPSVVLSNCSNLNLRNINRNSSASSPHSKTVRVLDSPVSSCQTPVKRMRFDNNAVAAESLSSSKTINQGNQSIKPVSQLIGTPMKTMNVKRETLLMKTYVRRESQPGKIFVKEETQPVETVLKQESQSVKTAINQGNQLNETVVKQESQPVKTVIKQESQPVKTVINQESQPVKTVINQESQPVKTVINQESQPVKTVNQLVENVVNQGNQPVKTVNQENQLVEPFVNQKNQPIKTFINEENQNQLVENVVNQENQPVKTVINQETQQIETVVRHESEPEKAVINQESQPEKTVVDQENQSATSVNLENQPAITLENQPATIVNQENQSDRKLQSQNSPVFDQTINENSVSSSEQSQVETTVKNEAV